ncbi:MAG: hypothetical protein WA484_01165 [Solirubrobacteraceae bacterium]
MAGVEVCLFDAGRGVLTEVREGTAIRVHTVLPERPVPTPVELGTMRPLAVYELLQRVLEHADLSVRFLDDTSMGGPPTSEQCVELVLSGADGPVIQSEHTGRSLLRFRDAQEEFGFPALALYLLSAHYFQPLEDPLSALPEAYARVERIREIAIGLRPEEPSPPEMRCYMSSFRLGLSCDLDTPLAFRSLFEWLREAELREDAVGDGDLREMLALLELEELLAG